MTKSAERRPFHPALRSQHELSTDSRASRWPTTRCSLRLPSRNLGLSRRSRPKFRSPLNSSAVWVLGVRKRLRQSTSRPGVASAAFGTITGMTRCLSALDGRPAADRSRGTGSTRSRKEDCGLHSPRNHAANRAPGRDRPGGAAVAPAHRAVAPGSGVGPAARSGGALNKVSAAETATLAFVVRSAVETTALVITRQRISLR